MGKTVRETFRMPADLDLSAIDPRGRPVGPRDKAAAAADMTELGERLDHLQEALYAEATGGSPRAVLLVLQGMDTSGKGGVIRHVGGLVNPQGLQIATFKKPTDEELAHDFLWRVRRQVPVAGRIGIFDRSHYEDVLIARVDSLVPEDVWRRRYTEIAQFEAELDEQGVTIVKCMLHISAKEQAERLVARLDDPAKRWKYNPGDLDARAKWPAYQEAYAEALRRTDTSAAPWYVIPSDRKWYRNWAIAALLAETLADLDPRFPKPDFDVDAERARLAASTVP
ncbi:PPK2 family polyphosphate kinase [Pseudonocardia adelaidensis]|uniref:Polyphosphate--nucleotide phosphotransferase n=1 Tax=Pseudonocardia adelaidensis TaxID=648754 RepID=A0ABP9NJV7_9PSEU